MFVLVTRSCPTLCDSMDCCLPGSSVEFSRQEYCSGLPFPSPGNLPDPGIKTTYPRIIDRFFTLWAAREAPVMLPNPHLTSHSKMSGSMGVTTPPLLSGSLRLLLYSSSVHSCHFLISSASVRSLPFLSFSCPPLHEMFPWYLQFSWRDILTCSHWI